MSTAPFNGEHVPMPVRADVAGTVRNDDTTVARVSFVDPVGQAWDIDLTPDVAIRLAHDLLTFVVQVKL